MLKDRFYLFFIQNKKRRFKKQKLQFIKDYLKYFKDLNFNVQIKNTTIFIGNDIDARIVFVCRYNSNRQLLNNKNKYYPLYNKHVNNDHLVRFGIIFSLGLLYFILTALFDYDFLIIIYIFLVIGVIIGKSNYHNFSSAGSLFLLQELALIANVNDVLFVLFDEHNHSSFNLKNKAYHTIIYLDNLVYGNDLLLATRNIERSEIKTDILEAYTNIFYIRLSPSEFTQFDHECKLLVLSLGFKEHDEFYCKYIDTNDDVTLNLVVYTKILIFLKQLVLCDTL